MDCSINKNVKLYLASFLLFLLFIGCGENLTPPVESNEIEIDFPIGKKAIYARVDYLGDNTDSLTEMFTTIYSLQFDTVVTKGNSKEYIGMMERYSAPFWSNNPMPGGVYPEYYESGRILVTVDKNWVLFQNSEVIDAALIFMKRDVITTDTTDFPNWLYGQFPVFPSKVAPNTSYSVVRPGDGDSFPEFNRSFEVMDPVEWNDVYSSDSGLHYSTEYLLKFNDEFILNFSGIIDEKGIVLSKTTIENFITSTIDYPEGTDTTSLHLINRRIVDFINPDYTQELSWYADYVNENGLTFLKDE